MTKAYDDALAVAHKELSEAEKERQALDIRILRLKQTIATLMRLIGHDVPTLVMNKGITDAVRDYLTFAKATNHGPVTIREVRSQLEIVGYDFSNYKNANASIAGTLERLVDAKEVRKLRKRRDDGVTVTGYLWLGEVSKDVAAEITAAKESITKREAVKTK